MSGGSPEWWNALLFSEQCVVKQNWKCVLKILNKLNSKRVLCNNFSEVTYYQRSKHSLELLDLPVLSM